MKQVIMGLLCTIATCAQAQTIKNASFEQGTDGWEVHSLKTQTNNSFSIKSGNTYMEKWTGKGGQVGDGSLQQTLTNMPNGVYVLTVAAQNIQEDSPTAEQTGAWVFAGTQRVKVDVRKNYEIRILCMEDELTIGFEAVSASGNWIAVDNFRLEAVDATHDELGVFLEEVKKLATQTMYEDDQKALDTAIKNAQAVYDTNSDEGCGEAARNLLEARTTALEAIYKYQKDHASAETPLDVTKFVVNPSFEKGWDGWSANNMGRQTNDAFSIKDGNTYVEKWVSKGNKVGDALLKQQIKGMEPGIYIVKCSGQNIQEDTPTAKQKGAYLFGNQTQTIIETRGEYELTFNHIDGTMSIGFEAEGATGNWIAVDNFRLYYTGFNLQDASDELSTRITAAEPLLEEKMNTTCREALSNAIEQAKALKVSPDNLQTLANTADALTIAVDDAELSITAFKALANAIEQAETAYGTGSGKEATKLREAIDKAIELSNTLTSTNEELYAEIPKLERACYEYRLDNATGTKPKVTTDPRYVHACKEVFGRMEVTGVSSTNIMEQGFVYSETNPEPTVLDEKSNDYLDHNGKIYRMPMKAGTLYYIRAYAMTKTYAVGYGDVIRVSTLPQGNVTWSYDYASDEEAQNNRIEKALKDASGWWTNYTSIRGFNIDGHWSPGTPTADCGYGGYMRIGTNMGQRCGTVLHEMCHGVGTGTLDIWGGWVDSPLRVTMNGDWAGDRANNAIQFWENDNNVVVTGAYDNAHWGIHHVGQAYEDGGGGTALWMNKYAINGAHLEPGAWAGPSNWNDEQVLFIGNSIIVQGFMEDGLVPVNAWSGGVNLPTYTFEHKDGQKYYLTCENANRGRIKSYLTEGANGVLKWLENGLETDVDEDGDGMNDAAAWYITFDAQKQLYRFQNAATGHYLSNTTGTTMKAVSKTTMGNTENFTLMRRRSVNAGDDPYLGYWITNYTSRNSLQANAVKAVASASQNLWDSSSQQRWLILTADEAIYMSVGEKQEAVNQLAELVKNLRIIEKTPYTEDAADTDSHTPFVEQLEKAEACLASAADVEVLNEMYTVTLQAGMDYIGAVSPTSEPFELTFLLKNPTIAENAKGWDGDVPTYNYACGEFFETAFDFNQTITGLPKGYYELTAQGLQRPAHYNDAYDDFLNGTNLGTSYLYLGSKTKRLEHIGSAAQNARLGGVEIGVGSPIVYIPDNMQAAGIYFDKGFYQNSVVYHQVTKGRDMKLGVRNTKTADGYWTIFRNFHLYGYGHNNPTGIKDIMAEDTDGENRTKAKTMYDMSGRAITSPTRGLYIQGGQKVLVK